MKINVLSCDDFGNVELDLDDEGQTYLIKLGFETLIHIAMDRLAEEVGYENSEAR